MVSQGRMERTPEKERGWGGEELRERAVRALFLSLSLSSHSSLSSLLSSLFPLLSLLSLSLTRLDDVQPERLVVVGRHPGQ
jgi:hypothetical protein